MSLRGFTLHRLATLECTLNINGPSAGAREASELDAGATVNTLGKLPSDLGLPRVGVIGGGGCGKTTILQRVVVPVLELFFEKVVLPDHTTRRMPGSSKMLRGSSGRLTMSTRMVR